MNAVESGAQDVGVVEVHLRQCGARVRRRRRLEGELDRAVKARRDRRRHQGGAHDARRVVEAQRTRTHTSDFRGARAAPSPRPPWRRAADEERPIIDVPLEAVEVGIRVVLLQIVGGECPHLLAQPVEAGARVGARRARVVEIVLADHGLVRRRWTDS